MPYFLDGNNLIGLARRTARPSQADRSALVSEIADRLRRTRARAVIFFDGTGERNAALGPLSIRAALGSADDAILSEIERARSAREIVVVTADRDLTTRARNLGAKTLSPAEFWSKVGASTGRQTGEREQSIDVEEWLKYFEDEENRE